MINKRPIGIAGHAGVGHANGYGGFIQDDSGGFGTVGLMIKDILGADTRVNSVHIDTNDNTIRITTMDGGEGVSSARRGITPAEAKLIGAISGEDALYCQSLAVNTLGRIYGQGVLETPTALQGALANAVVDTFSKISPDSFDVCRENLVLNCGLMGGLCTRINGIETALMVSVNHSRGGIGPVEDFEGNIPLGAKGQLMRRLGMLKCPTIIVESKAYLPAISDSLRQNTFLVRAQKDIDNPVVANALVEAAEDLGFPVIFRDDVLPHHPGLMKQNTARFADELIGLAQKLKMAEFAADKVQLVADMADLVSRDAGAVTCISNRLHDVVRGVGMIPGTAAVISMLVPQDYYRHFKIPLFDEQDARHLNNVISLALEKISANPDDAYDWMDKHYVDPAPLEATVK